MALDTKSTRGHRYGLTLFVRPPFPSQPLLYILFTKRTKIFELQDRSASVLSVIVPEKSRAADVTVSLSGFDFKGGTKCAKSLLVEHKPSGTVVQGELEYYCRAEDDDLLSYWEVCLHMCISTLSYLVLPTPTPTPCFCFA